MLPGRASPAQAHSSPAPCAGDTLPRVAAHPRGVVVGGTGGGSLESRLGGDISFKVVPIPRLDVGACHAWGHLEA